jgi:uncharacterized protein YceH (UPF0502 family)
MQQFRQHWELISRKSWKPAGCKARVRGNSVEYGSTLQFSWIIKEQTLPLHLTANEARVIGCLIEKSVVTPDQYPLTLNALTNACNQKSSRDPVLSLQQGEVQHTIRELESKTLVRIDENFKSRVEKYIQRFCNTRFSDYQFDPPQLAIVCLLLLRGPQTPGELRPRSGRLHSFEDNGAVVDALRTLMEWEAGPLVVKLPRTPGRKDAQYMHLFSGPVDTQAHASQATTAEPGKPPAQSSISELEQRVSDLETEVAALKEQVNSPKILGAIPPLRR